MLWIQECDLLPA